jgi:hypothetical protein
LGIGLLALPCQLVALLLRILEVSCHLLKVLADRVDALHLLLGLKAAQRVLNILLDVLREPVV